LGVKAYIPFAAAAMSWEGNPLLRERLVQCVKNAKAPIFFLQAQNDYNLGPSEMLGEELKRKGGLNRSKIYPPSAIPTSTRMGTADSLCAPARFGEWMSQHSWTKCLGRNERRR